MRANRAYQAGSGSLETEPRKANLTDTMLDLWNQTGAAASEDEPGSREWSVPQATYKQLQASFERQRIASESPERRSKTRYAIELNVRFFTAQRRLTSHHIGRTVNISSSGVLVAAHCGLKQGTILKLMIEWPWTLDGNVPLQLVATGMVVRSSQSSFAVAVRTHQFRTMKRSPSAEQSLSTHVVD